MVLALLKLHADNTNSAHAHIAFHQHNCADIVAQTNTLAWSFTKSAISMIKVSLQHYNILLSIVYVRWYPRLLFFMKFTFFGVRCGVFLLFFFSTVFVSSSFSRYLTKTSNSRSIDFVTFRISSQQKAVCWISIEFFVDRLLHLSFLFHLLTLLFLLLYMYNCTYVHVLPVSSNKNRNIYKHK